MRAYGKGLAAEVDRILEVIDNLIDENKRLRARIAELEGALDVSRQHQYVTLTRTTLGRRGMRNS